MPSYKEQEGKIKVQAKDELRTKHGCSPDRADALNLTRFLETATRVRVKQIPIRRKRRFRSWKVA